MKIQEALEKTGMAHFDGSSFYAKERPTGNSGIYLQWYHKETHKEEYPVSLQDILHDTNWFPYEPSGEECGCRYCEQVRVYPNLKEVSTITRDDWVELSIRLLLKDACVKK